MRVTFGIVVYMGKNQQPLLKPPGSNKVKAGSRNAICSTQLLFKSSDSSVTALNSAWWQKSLVSYKLHLMALGGGGTLNVEVIGILVRNFFGKP